MNTVYDYDAIFIVSTFDSFVVYWSVGHELLTEGAISASIDIADYRYLFKDVASMQV